MNVNKFNLKTTNKRSTIMIFLNEDIVSSGFTSASSELRKLNEELGLNEADFAQFANPNAGYEICYEMEMAFNALERQMLNEEAAILLSEAEEGEGEKESKGFWTRVWDTIVRWAKNFLEILGKAWNAIKNFFKKIWEFLFGRKAKENVEETKKELKLASRDMKFKFIKVDFDAITAIWAKFRKIEGEAKKVFNFEEETVVVDAKDLQAFVKDVKKDLEADVKKFKENKDYVIGTAAEAEKNLENALKANGFIKYIQDSVDDYLAASKHCTETSKKIAGEIKSLSGKKLDRETKEELKDYRNSAAAFKSLAVLMKELATAGTSIISTVSPAIRGAQNPKKVRA